MSIEKIERRKKELQLEIDQIEDKYISQAAEIERKVKTVLKPVKNIRTRPFTSIGISIAVGFVIGFVSKRKNESKSKKSSEHSYQSANSDDNGVGFTTLFLAELKRLAAQRAMMYISEVVDKKVMPTFTSKNDQSVSKERKEDEQAYQRVKEKELKN